MGAPGLAFETWDPSNRSRLETRLSKQKKSPCFQGLFLKLLQKLKPRYASIARAIPQESDPAAPAPGPSPPRLYKSEPE